MTNIYCGIGKIQKGHRRGNMRECAEKGQIRYYGIKKIDTKTLEATKNKDSIPETREKLFLEISHQRGIVNRYKGRYEKAPKSIDQQTKDVYYLKWQTADKKLKIMMPKFQKLEAIREKERNMERENMEKEQKQKQEKKLKGKTTSKTKKDATVAKKKDTTVAKKKDTTVAKKKDTTVAKKPSKTKKTK